MPVGTLNYVDYKYLINRNMSFCPGFADLVTNIKPIALAIVELYLSDGINQLLSQSVENSLKQFFKNSVATF